MCPHHDDQEWSEMTPEDMSKAIDFELELQRRDPGLYLHPSRQPLETVDFDERTETRDGCQTGFCFT